jgi:uncharacterized protein
MAHEFGLKPNILASLIRVFATHSPIEKAVLYGSRTTDHYREGSDIDIALWGNVNFEQLSQITDEVDDLYLPYCVDLCLFDDLNNDAIKEQIQNHGVIIYHKENS